jgi:NAD(P)-dependent dehydrogenase (short-subunit alcohol dehydrogenase family)
MYRYKDGRLKNKCALVIGATSGIGQGCAEMFAEQGARVIVTGRRVVEGEAVARNIVAAGGDAAFLQCDVTKPEPVAETVRLAVDRLGRLDILLNNAGGSSSADGLVTTGSLDEFWEKCGLIASAHFSPFASLFPRWSSREEDLSSTWFR